MSVARGGSAPTYSSQASSTTAYPSQMTHCVHSTTHCALSKLDCAEIDAISALDRGESGSTGPNPNGFDCIPDQSFWSYFMMS